VIYDDNGGTGSDIRVNNLSETAIAVPEPASIAMAGVGPSVLLRRRRR